MQAPSKLLMYVDTQRDIGYSRSAMACGGTTACNRFTTPHHDMANAAYSGGHVKNPKHNNTCRNTTLWLP